MTFIFKIRSATIGCGQYDVNEFTAGLSFLPIRQVVAKADFQLRDRRYGLDELGINFGIGWLF